MSYHPNTELLEQLYERFRDDGYSEDEAEELAQQEYDLLAEGGNGDGDE